MGSRSSSREDWYRRTTWTEEDQRAFFARNARSRGADSKEQYIRIQAETLLETGGRDLVEAALVLLEQGIREYPAAVYRAASFDAAGRCCALLSKTDDAVAFYRRALVREAEFPGLRTNARFHLAKLAIEARREDLYDEALTAAEAFGAPVFPAHAYYQHAIRAMVALRHGERELAKIHAAACLAAAAVRDTGLSRGRGHLGTVQNRDSRLHDTMRRIADG